MDNKTKKEGQEYSNNIIDSMEATLNKLVSEDDNEHEEAVEEIANFGLSVSKQTIIDYLISTGGPAYKLRITFNEDKEITSIKPQYHDWGTYWETMETTSKQEEILRDFVLNLYLEETILLSE